MHFSSALFCTGLLTLANGAVLGKRSLSGEATFYGGNVAGGACSFSTYTLPSNILATALSDSNWDNSANCGACVSVTGPSGNSILAMIVDECPGCGTNHLDLFPDAFADLANPSTGIIDVTWDYVDCPITSALSVHNKEGVSAYWFSMQVINANKAVASLDVSTDGGSTWQTTTRQTYNFFENSSGFGTTTVDVKIISVDGDIVIVNNVGISSGASTTASSNFGSSAVASTKSAVVSPTTSAAAAPSPTTPAVVSKASKSPVTSISTTSQAPVVILTTSEAPVASSTAYPGGDFVETSVSEVYVTPTALASSTIPTSPAPTTSVLNTPSSILAPITPITLAPSRSTVTVFVEACEA
ncbi:Expansin 5 [Hyphodiscus hymeniophilus]|uniref:Expansin 5 n=1 Tax=Hyphodiscus hymeniophilus TaxID=353542 RepID=A0A9P6VM40_9HELO|nr:Expansin 5 [Hyphodiscus hymeniophilus]